MLAVICWLIIITLGYAALCAEAPFGRCRHCRGFGFLIHKTRSGRLVRGKNCRRCDASGIRLRLGRRAWNFWTRTHRDSTR